MGRDKARLALDGVPFAIRVARPLTTVAYPVLAVGGAAGTGLESVRDPGQGPLGAFVAGWRALEELASDVPALIVVACDLPFVTEAVLGALYGRWRASGADAVVPVVAGRPQPLAACYAMRCGAIAQDLYEGGARSMRELLAAIEVRYHDMNAFARELRDVDTPEDYETAKSSP